MARLVIKPHRPVQWIVGVGVLSVLIALTTWSLLDQSYWRIVTAMLGDDNGDRSLMERNRELEAENQELASRIIMLEQTTKVDKETAIMLQKEIIASQDQIYQLKRELEFYQGAMDSARRTVGMNINGMYVEPAARANHYLLKLVLTHVAKNDTVMKGTLSVNIEGTLDGDKKQFDLAGILDEKADFGFEFKSFKRMEYAFSLAEGFVPEKVTVKVVPLMGGDLSIIKTYDWPI